MAVCGSYVKTVSLKVKTSIEGGASPSDRWKTMARQAPDNVHVKSVRLWQNKRQIALRPIGPPWPGRRHKAELAGGGGDAIQAKRKKLSQGVSMKSLKRAYYEMEFQEKLQRAKS